MAEPVYKCIVDCGYIFIAFSVRGSDIFKKNLAVLQKRLMKGLTYDSEK